LSYAPEISRPSSVRIPREIVGFNGGYAPGTVVVSTSERRLYYVLPGHQAIKYGIGVGRAGFDWSGRQTISRKQEWPDWRPPAEMLQRRPDLPRYMAGGLDNPLGARALYLGGSLYRIHGSNEPETIGQAVSSGCIRMLNDDVVDLYNRVKVGTPVVVLR
jgi:lipoprotein-anchoring transpeptidase ErfK/SrfK